MKLNLKQLSSVIAAITATIMLTPTAFADMNGIDISAYQHVEVACNADAEFVVVKATGGLGYENPRWKQQADCAISTGKELGFYHFAGDGTPGSAVSEADHFVNTVSDYIGVAVLALDWEDSRHPAWNDGNWIRQFVTRVHDRTKVWPMIYTYASAVRQIPSDVRAKCALWVAEYGSTTVTGYQTSPWNLGKYGEAMRQYTSSGCVKGYCTGLPFTLDLNKFRGDRAAWRKYANPTGSVTTKPVPAPAPKPQPTPAILTRRFSVRINYGDTMWNIAARYNAWPLSKWSVPSGNLNRIYPGQTAVYNGSSTPTVSQVNRYTVRAGDTLSSIASRYGISYTQIRGYRSGNPNVIWPGEVVYW